MMGAGGGRRFYGTRAGGAGGAGSSAGSRKAQVKTCSPEPATIGAASSPSCGRWMVAVVFGGTTTRSSRRPPARGTTFRVLLPLHRPDA